ncbi:hypothetical protein WG68_15530 [Arsukibacterium ikkense]|uniref:Yip1 domain-containing protein n=1 Tax=Arsukibacterium ikkense TaxID=336831 RepID=A0A0M2V265_9GAMM|nr:YIP1 family protein [Arsukibacterium ikkense]KKO44464.1 hypothetical protein WG68_15530 [Arsukibacterium ikkense]
MAVETCANGIALEISPDNKTAKALYESLGYQQQTEYLHLIMFGALLGGMAGGLISIFLFSWLLKISGRWIGGQATSEHLRAAMAWGAIPILCTLLLWVPLLALYGNAMFSSDTQRITDNLVPYFILIFLELLLAIWGVILIIKCVGQVQGFSAWRALGNVMLAILLFIVPVVLLGVLVAVMTG